MASQFTSATNMSRGAPCYCLYLLLSAVACEWVEISQQHYRKPFKTIKDQLSDEDTIGEYINHSLDYNWHQEDNKPTNIDSVKRVHVERTNAKDTSHAGVQKITHDGTGTSVSQVYRDPGAHKDGKDTRKHHGNLDHITTDLGTVNSQINYNRKDDIPSRHGSMNFKHSDDDKVKGTVQKVSNVGSVKRVQLANTPVKSPTFKLKPEETALTPSYGDSRGSQKGQIKIINRIATNDTDKYTNQLRKYNFNPDMRTENPGGLDNLTRVININSPEFVTDDESMHNHYRDFVTTETILLLPANTHESLTETYVQIHKNNAGNPVFVTKEDITREHINKNTNSDKMTVGKKNSPSDENVQPDSKESVKEDTIENVIKFMKVVAQTISRNTRSFGNKITYLQELKRNILANIEAHIDSTWPDDAAPDTPGLRRRSRTVHEEALSQSRGHVEFPSSEGALMTISFLTFAVFLIKLVLQVIQTYKNKTMLVAPLVVATARRFRERGRN